VAATALFDGSHEPRAPMTKGRVRPRQLYFWIFLGWPVVRDLGASNVMARSMIMDGVAKETRISGIRMEPGKSLFTVASSPAPLLFLKISINTRFCRWPIAGRSLRQWLMTCKVVLASTLHLRHFMLGAEKPGFPISGSSPRRLLWIRFHSSNERIVREDGSRVMSLDESVDIQKYWRRIIFGLSLFLSVCVVFSSLVFIDLFYSVSESSLYVCEFIVTIFMCVILHRRLSSLLEGFQEDIFTPEVVCAKLT
jgi:hypothetical protein